MTSQRRKVELVYDQWEAALKFFVSACKVAHFINGLGLFCTFSRRYIQSTRTQTWDGGEGRYSPPLPHPHPTVWWWCNEAWGTSHHYFLLLQSPSFILLPFLIPPIYCKYAILLPSFLPSISTSCYYTTAAVIYPPITSFTLLTPCLNENWTIP